MFIMTPEGDRIVAAHITAWKSTTIGGVEGKKAVTQILLTSGVTVYTKMIIHEFDAAYKSARNNI